MRAFLLSFLLFPITFSSSSQAQTVIPLWEGHAPQSHGDTPTDIPTLTVFLPKDLRGPSKEAGPTSAIVICPGGGYVKLSMVTEGVNEAQYFQSHGVAAFVLKYRLPVNGYRHPVPLLDAQRAIRLVRSHAADWKINPAKVGVMGFSAGGHLAATLETHFDPGNVTAADPADRPGCRPDFTVLVYAAVSLKNALAQPGSTMGALLGPNPDPALVESLSNETQVTPQTPPTILVQAEDDQKVPIANSRLMYAALQKAGVTSALDVYPHGGHGFGFGPNQHAAPPGWLDKVYAWLKAQSMVP